MSSISVSSLVLGSLTMEVEGADASLSLSVLATAPAVLSVELGTPGAQGDAATIAVGTTTTLSPGSSATVANAGTSSAAVFNFGIPTGPTGPTGATGATGSPGTAATIAAGTTTTGAPGSSASVTNSGTSGAAVFDFTIPRGDVGATGATGATGAVGPGVAVGGTTGQLLTKASGTNYDTTWTTVIPGDRYLTTSTTSLTINNANKTLTVGTGLSYTPTQNVTISYDASHHMHGEVLTYDSGTGVMTVDVNNHTGSGTYAAWTVNVGGVTPATSTSWGSILGTLSAQTDLQTALDSKLAKASNLSDLVSAPTARTNLGLGTAAVEPATKLVPSGGTTGQVLAKASATSWDLQWATAGGGGGGVDIQVFGSPSTSGTFTWTKPANAKMVYFWMVGGGGGGGSGARHATTTTRGGGGGGGGGNAYAHWVNPAFLGATETVTVGAGVTGAPGVLVNSTNGSTPATSANVSSRFAGFRTYGDYGGGQGGTAAGGGSGGSTGNHMVDFGTIASVIGVSGTSGTATTNNSSGYTYHAGLVAGGGSGGAGQFANLTTSTSGGFGTGHASYQQVTGPGRSTIIAGGTRGNFSPLTVPGNGVAGGFNSSVNSFVAGTGGGGGAYISNAAGQNGGNGGWPGGGGGGGAASDNGFTSGAGGNGANGIVVVITYS